MVFWYNSDMTSITYDEIQRDLTGYLDRVKAGESLLVTQGDLVVAEIRPVQSPSRSQRPYALCRGEFVTPDDFNELLSHEILAEFEGQ